MPITIHHGPATSFLAFENQSEVEYPSFGPIDSYRGYVRSVGGSSFVIYVHQSQNRAFPWIETALFEVVNDRLVLKGHQPKVEHPTPVGGADDLVQNLSPYVKYGPSTGAIEDAWHLGSSGDDHYFAILFEEASVSNQAEYVMSIGVIRFNASTGRLTSVDGTQPWIKPDDLYELGVPSGLTGYEVNYQSANQTLLTFIDGRLWVCYGVVESNTFERAMVASSFTFDGSGLQLQQQKVITSRWDNRHPKLPTDKGYGDFVIQYFSAHGDHILLAGYAYDVDYNVEMLGAWKITSDGDVTLTADLDPGSDLSYYYGGIGHIENAYGAFLYDGYELLYYDQSNRVRLYDDSFGAIVTDVGTRSQQGIKFVLGSPRQFIEVGYWPNNDTPEFPVYPYALSNEGLTAINEVTFEYDTSFLPNDPSSTVDPTPRTRDGDFQEVIGIRNPTNNQTTGVLLGWDIYYNGSTTVRPFTSLITVAQPILNLNLGPKTRRMRFRRT